MIGNEGTQITMAARNESTFAEKESRNKPGPGSYDHFGNTT